MNLKTYKVLFSLVLIILGSLVLTLVFGFTAPLASLNKMLANNNDKFILAFIGLLTIVVGFLVLKRSFKEKASSQTHVSETKFGAIKITINTLEDMTEKIAKNITGIKDAKTKIKSTPAGIAVFIEISVTSDINIPKITEETQNKVNDYISNQVGIQVEEVRILVSNLAKSTQARVE